MKLADLTMRIVANNVLFKAELMSTIEMTKVNLHL